MSRSDAPVFALVSDSSALLQLAEDIRGDPVRSGSVHNVLLIHGKGYMDKCNFYVLKNKKDSPVVLLKYKNSQDMVAVYCTVDDEPLLLDALDKTDVLDWQSMICFFYVPDTLREKLQGLAAKKSGQELTTFGGNELYVYDPKADTEPLVCPEGTALKRMGIKAVDQMFSAWRYKECHKTNLFLELCQKVPNVGLFPADTKTKTPLEDLETTGLPKAGNDEEALGWVTSTLYGPMGLLSVDPNTAPTDAALCTRLRRLLASSCAQLMLKEGFLVQTYRESDEEHMKDLPGWSKAGFVWWMWRPLEEKQKEGASA